MIRFTVCLLLSTASLAQHYAAPGPSALPMDYNDDIYNRDMRIQPSSNFVFNFEQARRDQPPQIEVREENLGKYMGRPRTTTPMPEMPRLHAQRVPDIDDVHLHHLTDVKPVSIKPYVAQNWDPISSHLPATIPPPPSTPKWMDLSDDTFKHHSHYHPSRHPVNHYQSAPTQAPVPQWTPPPPPTYMEERVQQPQVPYNPMSEYVHSSTEYSAPAEHYAYEQPRPRSSQSRGSHKFNWNDVAVPQQPSVMPTTTTLAPSPAAPLNRAPPSSIPTLSPWYGDSYGK